MDVVTSIKNLGNGVTMKHHFYPPLICSSRNLPNHSPFHSLHLPPGILLLKPSSSSSSVLFSGGNGGRRGKPLVEVQNPTTSSPMRRPFLCCATSGGSDDGSQEDSTSHRGRPVLLKVAEVLPMVFPLWVALACFLALVRPSAFSWVHNKWQMIGLTITMLGMGMTLTLDDLRGAMLMPKELLSGFVLQYTVMPLSGFLVSKLLNLPSHYAAGLILVSCCPGGDDPIFDICVRWTIHSCRSSRSFYLHSAGFFFGYSFSRMFGIDVSSSRTISIEVGMQNSLLGLVLAVQHFGNPLTAVPCALSSLIHLVYGSVLAGIWRSMKPATPLKD